ncbi:MAG: hypothetical protein K5905_24060 [Roseibium sp.]|uniref:hypothetical protein n=1 Tax=Roseibium sp. TaxID=1936156 RepID=UPI002620954B|nr:hypothetical protein [Roseibium sp.]MCV0428544.1 hypothetical protein [Roseibium sp.]
MTTMAASSIDGGNFYKRSMEDMRVVSEEERKHMERNMQSSKNLVGLILLTFGVVSGFVSFWYTLEFTWTPEFQATNLEIGPTHSNYHAFREALLALAVNLLLIRAGVLGSAMKYEYWATTTFMAVFYYSGWWLAWPIWGYHAPYVSADINHVIATIGGLSGLILLKPVRN